MKTSNKKIELAYDSLSNALNTFKISKATQEHETNCTHPQIALDGFCAILKQRGSELSTAIESRSKRCSDTLYNLCESLIDQSVTVLTDHLYPES